MFEDDLLSPEFLEIAAELTRSLKSEASAHLYHLADIRRAENSEPFSTADRKQYLAASFTPDEESDLGDLDPRKGELQEVARLLLGSHTPRWTQRGLICEKKSGRLEFWEAGRTTYFGFAPLVSGEFTSELVVHPKSLERLVLGFANAAAENVATQGWAFVTLVGLEGVALGRPELEKYFREADVMVRSHVDLKAKRADEALRQLIRKLWQAADYAGSPNFTETGWKFWDEDLT